MLMLSCLAMLGRAEEKFPLYDKGVAAAIVTDDQDFPVVGTAAGLLADDVERVTNMKPAQLHSSKLSDVKTRQVVIAGTIGKSRIIDELIKKRKIQVSEIRGKWESYVMATIDKPFGKIEKALVIAGSDRRGTAFGLLSLSDAIGVSPWYWWADVIPEKKDQLLINGGRYVQGEPSVQYRGFFINDERFGGWARWAELNFDKEHGVVGPKTYEKVFELLLRLKGNYLWPAMHPGTQPFNFDPENARLADQYAIVMGTSHCEQMLRNNEGEWKAVNEQAKAKGKEGYGDFNYITNRPTMQRYWEERIKTNGQYENTYTIGLRGVHDYPMEGADTPEERVRLMQQAIDDQREILQRVIKKPAEEIPQVLCTYEEVLDAYHDGLRVPDDVTLLWSDDKQGYMRNLCNPQERQRKGGAGVYYHLSYHGDPDSWFWLSPLSPALISMELTKAYEYGARKIWVFNVGDIKPAEKELTFAMQLAWDVNRWTPERAHQFIGEWAAETFFDERSVSNGAERGPDFADRMASMQARYYRLMAYGKEFHTRWLDYSDEEIADRLQKWNQLKVDAETLREEIPERLQAAYYELFLYPITGAALMNQYVLEARRSMALASAGNDRALLSAMNAEQAKNGLDAITDYYNTKLLSGKWNHFFNWHPNWYLDGKRPVMEVADAKLLEKAARNPAPQMLFSCRDGYDAHHLDLSFRSEREGTLPLWVRARTPIKNNSFAPENNVFCQVHTASNSYVASAKPHGNIWHTSLIGPMWSQVGEVAISKGENTLSLTDIDTKATIYDVFIGIQPPFDAEPCQRIAAKDYTQIHQGRRGQLKTIPQLGYQDGVMVVPCLTDSYEPTDLSEAPWLEYNIESCGEKGRSSESRQARLNGRVVTDEGEANGLVEIRTLPTLRVYTGRQARYAVSIDGGTPQVFDIHEDDYSAEWRWNVLRGYTRRWLPISQGRHTVRIYLLDPGIVLQEVVTF